MGIFRNHRRNELTIGTKRKIIQLLEHETHRKQSELKFQANIIFALAVYSNYYSRF